MLASLAYVLVLFFRSSINLIEDEVGVTLAVFNLTMGKWVCPAPPKPTDQTATQQTLPIDAPNVRAYSLENCLLSRLILQGMFSLEEARILDANETNFKNSVVQILTGIPVDVNQQNTVVSKG